MHSAYRIIVAEVPCSRRFPEIQRELGAIGGKTPTGEDRLKLEWGGTATRPFGGQLNCKYGLFSETVIVGWRFAGNPNARKKRDRMTLQFDGDDLTEVPDSIALFSDGTPRVFTALEAVVDHPIPNWFIADWLSPAQMGGGPFGARYGRGYWNQIWRCYDESRNSAPWYGYRDPDAVDIEVIREYWHTKVTDLDTMGVHIDDPITGVAAEIQGAWMNRAAAHLAAERLGERTEETIHFLEKYLSSDRNTDGGRKPLVDLGAMQHV